MKVIPTEHNKCFLQKIKCWKFVKAVIFYVKLKHLLSTISFIFAHLSFASVLRFTVPLMCTRCSVHTNTRTWGQHMLSSKLAGKREFNTELLFAQCSSFSAKGIPLLLSTDFNSLIVNLFIGMMRMKKCRKRVVLESPFAIYLQLSVFPPLLHFPS